MSTVVGTCTDCIVSLPAQPPTSMKFSVSVTEGFNSILKRVGTVNGIYPSASMALDGPTLAPGASYAIGATKSLCIGTSAPLQVTVTVGSITMTFNVNSLLILDDAYTSVRITNPSTTINAVVALFYTQ